MAAFFDDLAASYCEYALRCCSAEEIAQISHGTFSEADDCEAARRLELQGDSLSLQLAAEAGEVVLDGEAARTCLQDWASRPCGGDPAPPPTCAYPRLIDGLQRAGEPCGSQLSCAEGARCVESIATSARICLPFRSEGDPCEAGEECAPGLACTAPPSICSPLSQEGEYCDEIACDGGDPDLYCDRLAAADRPICARRRDDGERCSVAAECKSRYCELNRRESRCATPKVCDGA